MDRNTSSGLGERQAEGNLGNERVRNRSSEESRRREPSRNRDRSGGSATSEDWMPSGDTQDNNGARNGGTER